MKKILLLILTVSVYLDAAAADPNVYFTQFPLQRQVFPRDTLTNTGTAVISGFALSQSAYSTIAVQLYRENVLQKTFTQNLNYINDSAGFSFNVAIKAELAHYGIKVFGVKGNAYTLINYAQSILAGDAFIIQGQSNAESVLLEGSSNEENQSSFIRVYGSGGGHWEKEWKIGNGDVGAILNDEGNTGQWGLRLAKHLIDSFHVPVVVFNGAHGGKPISYFKKRNDSTNNYAYLARRVLESGFVNNIRAIFWYQGESDSNPGNSIDDYKETFYEMYNNWKADYKGFQRLYIVQINQSCGVDKEGATKIEEAQRQLADEIPGATLFATNGIEHAGVGACHYAYENGYKLVGDYLFSIVNRDLRGLPNLRNIESPQVTHVVQTDSNKLVLHFRNQQDTYVWEAGVEKDFVLNGIPAKVASGVVNGSTIILTLNKKIGVDSISFYGHGIGGSPCIRNLSGAGIAGFYGFTVTQTASFAGSSNATVQGLSNKLKAYPTPAHDFVMVEYNLTENSPVVISILDFTGKKLAEIKEGSRAAGNNQSKINISGLQRGTYFLQVQTGKAVSSVRIEKI